GIIFIILTLSGIREKIINFIPGDLKLAVGAGIGFFIAFLGFQNAGIIVGDDATLVSIGNLTDPYVMLAIFGIIISVIFLFLHFDCSLLFVHLCSLIFSIQLGHLLQWRHKLV